MRISALACLSLMFLLASADLAFPQDDAPPDYSKTPLKEWIAALMDTENRERHEHAFRALGPNGPYSKVAIPALIAVLDKRVLPDYIPAANVLANYGPAVIPQLLEALKKPDAKIREGAITALAAIRPNPPEVPTALIAPLQDAHADVRSAAALALGRVGRKADGTVPALSIALRDRDSSVRSVAASALGKVGRKKAEPAIPALIAALKDDDGSVLQAAAWTLRDFGPAAKAAVPELIKGLKNPKFENSHDSFADALEAMGPDARDAVPVLIDCLHRKTASLPRSALAALSAIGPDAKAAVPKIIEIAKDYYRHSEQSLAITALGKIGPDAKTAVPMLIEALRKGHNYTVFRTTVAEALGGIGPPAKDAVPILAAIARNQLEGENIDYAPTREAASKAVMKIDPEYGKKNDIEFACRQIRLGKIAPIKLAPSEPVSPERKTLIKKLIADLAELKDPDYGMAPTLTGSAFAPLPDREHFGMGLITNHRLKTSDAFRRLVAIGPDALPFLLESLGDIRPTKMTIPPVGMTSFAGEISGNVLNSSEQRIIQDDTIDKDEEDEGLNAGNYELRIGDVCFVAIGQIVGRTYSAVRYQPSLMVFINSPVQSKALREKVRAIWSSKNPAEKLLQSYLIDYATEWKPDPKDSGGWSEASRYQVEAVVRLLFYFPKESTGVIVERLKRIDVMKPKNNGIDRDKANGVDTEDFLKAVNWCKEPVIRQVLFDIFQRTDDLSILLAVLPSVNQTRPDLVMSRLRSQITKLPASEEDARGEGHRLLVALAEYAGDKAKPDFEAYLRDGSLQRRFTMCWVLEEVKQEWALEFLAPMLPDKRSGYAGGGWRLCDCAASALSMIHRDLNFDFEGTSEKRDQIIEKMRQQIARKRK